MATAVRCEVCVEDLAGIAAAERAGADRIELCSALDLGGLTPPAGLVRGARRATELPLFAMLRPRPGDFVIDRDERDWLVDELTVLRGLGVDGIVAGALTVDGDVDREVIAALVDAASGLPVTFHRAFDHVRDHDAALEELVACGVARILTSGGAARAIDGRQRIRRSVARAAGRITIVAGGGVRAGHVRELVAATGVDEVHLSAVRIVAGPARHAPAVPDFAVPGRAFAERRAVDAEALRGVVAALRGEAPGVT